MDYWKKQRLKEIMKHIVIVGAYCHSLYWNYSWDKEVL